MAKVKCEFCGNFIQDTDPECPVCGAVNENHQRIAKKTPKTIEELRSWYKARNLPPEDVTRFFIGKDVREPKAFGIYQTTSGNFVVYKNKANGQRAVRYEGTDEAYAVNELYLRLKEEILNQKTHNVQRKENKATYQPSTYYSTRSSSKRGVKRGVFYLLFPWLIALITAFVMFGSIFVFDEINSLTESKIGYYVEESSDSLYYYEGRLDAEKYRWWKFSDGQWATYQVLNYNDFILEFEIDDKLDLNPAAYQLGVDKKSIDIYRSKAFVDAGNHYQPETGYYQYNDHIYYYLNDLHSGYGNRDNSGWYLLDNSANDWGYYSNYDNRELLDDDLWYYEEDYYLGNGDLDIPVPGTYDWNATHFSSTEWYNSFLENESAYQEYLEENQDDDDYDWDSDSDYDWDSDSDWDSGDTDWDSDW